MTTPQSDGSPAPMASTGPDARLLTTIALGGVVGSLSRYAVGLAVPHTAGAWPTGTFVVNLTGCVAMGLLVAFLVSASGSHRLVRPFLGVGVLGGWTTYSAFAVDVVQLTAAGHGGLAAAYVLGSVVLGVGAVGLGESLGKLVWPGP